MPPSGRPLRTIRTSATSVSHPGRRMASLEAQQKPRTLRSQGLNQQDQLIAERLARLRQEDKPKPVASEAEIAARLAALRSGTQTAVPSTQEMEARLAVLQGRTLPPQALQPAQHSVDTRTQAQQTQDLLAQLTTEVALDESREQKGSVASAQNDLNQGHPGGHTVCPWGQTTRSPEEEKSKLLAQAAVELREENTRQERILVLAKRLAVLRGEDPDRVTLQDYHFPDSDDEEDEETAIQRILQQLTEEAALDEMSGFNIPVEPALQPQTRTCREEPKAPHPRPKAEDDELPWCCICNEDATLRCTGCNRDLYCARCFREGHDVFDLEEHQTSAYHPPRAGQDY
ncbi:abscission/NoCut checkpoint regulator isoform X2 [Erinaceus europaeus]|uniref:Abscission/NoCut checkpoint regulator isoform X2 n=1 Tax=Erinaceus europaeus TaxID=9365 RepID=A0ABM3W3I0_ERIEU|nr:abscission/NoCut checkpoint regulator isoform X2 [Erinaceus europaeus]